MLQKQILFIRATLDQLLEHVDRRKAYWSAGLPIVLEKHGYLSVDEAGPEALSNLQRLADYDVVLVARLPDEAWTEDILKAVFAGKTEVFLEGPLPATVLKALAIAGSDVSWKEGTINVVDEQVRTLAEPFGMGVGGQLKAEVKATFSRRPEGMEWPLASDCPISREQATLWSLVPWDFAPWRLREGPSKSNLVAELVDAKGGARWAAIARRHRVWASCFDLFSLLVWHHTAEPQPVDLNRAPDRVAGIEGLFLGILDAMFVRRARSRYRVMPWPKGVFWVLNVRHDVDRVMEVSAFEQLVALHSNLNSKATWYWRESTTTSDGMRTVRDAGHEIALHTERLYFGGEFERQQVESVGQCVIRGATAHGGHTSFRFQGAPNFHWAREQGFSYLELATRKNFHPHFFVWLNPAGIPEKWDIVCLARHISLDIGPRDGQAQPLEIHRQGAAYIRAGGFLQVMNHPDINRRALIEAIEGLPSDGRAAWSCAEMADWWRATHDIRRFSFGVDRKTHRLIPEGTGDRRIVFECLSPTGTRTYETLDLLSDPLPAHESGTEQVRNRELISPPETQDRHETFIGQSQVRPELPTWEDVQAEFRSAMRSYYEKAGTDPESTSAKSTIRTNTELVEARSKMLAKFVETLSSRTDVFAGKDIFEVGSGFGALGMYFLTGADAKSVFAIDVRDDFIRLSRAIADRAGLSECIRYAAMDMRDLGTLKDHSFDVIVCNNSLYYIPDRDGVAEALRQFRRLLRCDGILVIYQANRWRYRDAFTKAPLVHLMPVVLADYICKKMGWSHSHGRVEFISPPDLRFRLSRAGFSRIAQCGNFRSLPVRGLRGLLTDFFCTVSW